MGRSSRGAHGSKLDWSKHERAWADLLHKEIFETGRYFRKTEVNQFKSKPKNFVGKKNRESPEEDEGYEVGSDESNFGSTFSIQGRNKQSTICEDGPVVVTRVLESTSRVRFLLLFNFVYGFIFQSSNEVRDYKGK